MKNHIAKCERCEYEVEFKTYKRHWPKGWTQTERSRWGKKYNRRRGIAWWCSWCYLIEQVVAYLGILPDHRALLIEAIDEMRLRVQGGKKL